MLMDRAIAESEEGIAVRMTTTHHDLNIAHKDGRFWRSNGRLYDLAEVKYLTKSSRDMNDWEPIEKRPDKSEILDEIEG